jgi:FkbM family methyltransferase
MNKKQCEINFNGTILNLFDLESSETMGHLKREVCDNDEYSIKDLIFNDGDVVIDIGANVGLVSIFLAKKFPNIKIYSFEAHPLTYSIFLENIKLNNVKNIYPYNLAVFSKDDEIVEIKMDYINTGSSSCFNTYVKNTNDAEKVKTIKLDSIIENNNINKIKFLKIDCEGAEFDILEESKLIHEIEIENVGIEIHSYMKAYGKDVESLTKLVQKITKNQSKIKVYGK